MIRTKFVRVVGPGPDAKFHDEREPDVDCVTFFDRRYMGRVGQVVGRTAAGDDAGVGDTPKDPAYRVRFGPAFGSPAHENLFWTEELAPLRR